MKTLKLIVIGAGGVGKSCFLNRYINHEFDPESELTKGVDFFSKVLAINGNQYNFIFWDFAGQDHFKKFLPDFVEGTIAALFLFELTSFNSLDQFYEWKEILSCYQIPVFLVGTKSDLIESGKENNLDNFVEEIKKNYSNFLGYIKTSSKTGLNIDLVFKELIEKLF
ncbi:MAG: GTP-binding protein [Candidatus Lokiarchaeota archaeon]